MADVNELIQQIDLFLSDDENKKNKRLMVKLYHQAFPLTARVDPNCPGCVLKCWGKLELLKRNNYSELINNKKITMKKESAKGKYKFAPEYENANIFIPELHIQGLNESDLTDSLGDVIMTYGRKDSTSPGKYAHYLIEANATVEKTKKVADKADDKNQTENK